MSKKKVRRKKARRKRQMDWETHGDNAFSHDRVKHLRTSSVPETEEVPRLARSDEINATVVSVSGPWAFVWIDGREALCRIDERLMVGRSSVLAPGDEVLVEGAQDQPFVRAYGERRSKLSRPASGGGRVEEQVIAANIDLLAIVIAVREPRFKPGLVDRYLVCAQVGGVEPLLCLNKMDLVDQEPEEIELYRELGVHVILTSCKTGQGLEEFRNALRGKLSVFSGQSGVGKSTLLNAMYPDLDIETQEVSGYNEKGRHTTTRSQLYHLENDAARIIDTPGIRQLGLWDVSPEQVHYFFPEFQEAAAECQFRNCTHVHEPGCAVRDKLERGEITDARYRSYLRIRTDLVEQAREY